jgi:hypothetical protein
MLALAREDTHKATRDLGHLLTIEVALENSTPWGIAQVGSSPPRVRLPFLSSHPYLSDVSSSLQEDVPSRSSSPSAPFFTGADATTFI